MYAELAIYQSAVRGTFHYAVPDDLPVSIGQLVEVSFRTGLSQAIVLDLVPESSVPHPKPILDVLSDEPVVTPLQIALGRWMAAETFTPLGPCLWMMLPPGLAKRGSQLYTLVDAQPQAARDATGEAAAVLELLRERGPLRARQIDRALPKSRWRDAIKPLIAHGVVAAEAVLPAPEAKPQTVRVVWLKVSPGEVPGLVLHMRKSPKQAAVLNLLAREPEPVELAEITRQTGASPDSIRRLEAKGHIAIGEAEQIRDPLAGRRYQPADAPTLTPEQAACWQTIRAHMLEAHADRSVFRAFLLHGVTGSGKTEIYLRAIEEIVRQGRQAIVLVPEIALVAPTVGRFASRFPGRLAVVHSALTDGEQYDTWRRARAGLLDVVIGARSALFTPLPDVGLIVMDEEHDDSYKQSPPLPPPYYHARETAMAMLRHAGGALILGSATPDVTTVFRAQQGEITYLHLPNRVIVPRSERSAESLDAISAPLPPVQIVDMREELREGNKSMFSRALRVALQRTLDRGEQALLFLNRRGSATFVLCRDCGYVSRCPNCDIPLTYHQTGPASAPGGQLTCHYCGHREAAPEICPNCQSRRIRYFGAGTAAVEQAVLAEFTGAQVLRWDRDTAQGRQQHEAIWAQFAAGEANVLVGTQMIVKGLDLPRVTLMGVVLADTALGLPDYRAGERTFQLLTQAAGRAGRGWRGGQVIFQSYQPDHYAIQAASGHDYEAFYQREIEYRRLLGYPPYKRLVRLIFRSPNPNQVQRDAENVARELKQRIMLRNLTATTLIGPAPAFFGKIDGVYQWHLIARTTDPARLLGDFDVRVGWQVDVDPVDIL
ncbi:MAG: primosomal protein N' [Anaerolineae bacterium]|nr:primosomal protein N' [Anaerolineae bacterium]